METKFLGRFGFGVTAHSKGKLSGGLDGIGVYTERLHASLTGQGVELLAYSHVPSDTSINSSEIINFPKFRWSLIKSAYLGGAFNENFW